jgi:hypothetical protein
LKRPPSAVTVWVAVSRFVNVTRVPTRTLRLDGVNAKFMILTDAAIGAGGGVGRGVGRGVEMTAGGAGVGVATGVGEAVGDGVALPPEAGVAFSNDGGADWLVDCSPQAVSKHATTIARVCRITGSSVRRIRPRLIPADVTTV